jgi:hypothetical protein
VSSFVESYALTACDIPLLLKLLRFDVREATKERIHDACMSRCGKKTMPLASLKLWHDHVMAEGRDDLARTTAWCLLEQNPGDFMGIRAALKAAVKAGDHLEVAKVVRLVVDGCDKSLVLAALPRTNPLKGMGETGSGVLNSAKAYAESKYADTPF